VKGKKAKKRLQDRIDSWTNIRADSTLKGGKTKIQSTIAYHKPGSYKK